MGKKGKFLKSSSRFVYPKHGAVKLGQNKYRDYYCECETCNSFESKMEKTLGSRHRQKASQAW